MDTQTVIVTVTALITTLIAAFLGPFTLDRGRRRHDHQLRHQIVRERPYADFTTAVERVQLDIDLAMGGELNENEYEVHFRAMKELRSRIDVVGTRSARVWAFRCRLAITSMKQNFQYPGKRNCYRAKLHEARSAFVTYARAEVGLVQDELLPPVDAFEDSTLGHKKWMAKPVDPVAMEAVRVPFTEFGAETQRTDYCS